MSLIQTRGATATLPFEVNTLPSNTTDGSAPGVGLIDAGDEAIAGATLLATDGSLQISSHACSGPALGAPGGSANSSSNVNYVENFLVFSDTLPAGTPVEITFKLAAAWRVRGSVTQPYALSNGDASVFGEAFVRFYSDISGGLSYHGNFGAQQVYFNPPTRGMEGIFAGVPGAPQDVSKASAGEFATTFPATVGGQFLVNIETRIGATSAAFNPVVSIADGQMALRWGAEVVGGMADIRTPEGTRVPPPANACVECVLANLPPAAHGTPEPTSLLLLIMGCVMVGSVRTSHRVT
jgi:hypothetical protein